MTIATERAPAQTPKARRRPRRTRRPHRILRQVPTHLVLIAVCAAWTYPFVWMLSTAFKDAGEVFTGGLSIFPDQPSFENFARAWTTARLADYTVNTVIVAVSVTLIVVAVSSLAGYALGRGQMPGKQLVVAILVATMFLPKGYTILPIFILINGIGLNNTLFGIILAEAGPAHIVAILLFMGYFSQVPKELEEAAVVDGAGHWRIYARIMMPLALPVIATVSIFTFINAWNSFLIPLVFTLGAPDLRTVGVGMYSFFGENTIDWTGLAAGSIISVTPIIVVFLFLQRYFIEGIAGAVKG